MKRDTSHKTRATVVVGMSGGVDSSVTAALLKEQGYNVIGVTLKFYSDENSISRCCSPKDVIDARNICDKLNIPFKVVDITKEFTSEIITYFIEEYFNGRTPNPCIKCNKHIKFKWLLKIAQSLGATKIATGHYAKIKRVGNSHYIMKGKDTIKDQSYFLCMLTNDDLSKIIFPCGDYTKNQIRAIAKKFKLENYNKEESQEVCFIPGNDYRNFINNFKKLRGDGGISICNSGYIIDRDGKQLLKHSGIENYTVGQRRGLGISSSKRIYVTKIDPKTNTVTVGPQEELFEKEFFISNCNFFKKPKKSFEATVQTRYKVQPSKAKINLINGSKVKIELIEPQDSIAPGQAAVFYDKDVLIGGGWID